MHASDVTLHERTTPYDEPVPLMQARALVGTTVGGRYRLERVIGMGGMGAVYEAQHVHLATLVAIKILHRVTGTNPTRFEREARRAATIRHRGVARVLDYLVDPNLGACLVMELLEGETLGSRLRRKGKLPLPLCVSVMSQLLDALEHVHRAGFVHRDLKPANVFLTGHAERPEVKLLDFGIARAIQPAPGESLTLPGTILGTLRYMSPEQALGSRALDARADLYSVGALLYTCVTGRPPYRQRLPFEILCAMGKSGPARLADAPEACPRELRQAADRALSFAPEDRFASAAEFRDAIQGSPVGLISSQTLIGWADLPSSSVPPAEIDEDTLVAEESVPARPVAEEPAAALADPLGALSEPFLTHSPSPSTFAARCSSAPVPARRVAWAGVFALVALSSLVSFGAMLLWILA